MAEQGLGDLAGQLKSFTNRCVEFTRKFIGIADNFAFKDNWRKPIGGFLVRLKDLVDPSWITQQLEFNGSDSFVHNLHNHYTTKLWQSLLFVEESLTSTQGTAILPLG